MNKAHMLEYFEYNFMANNLEVLARAAPTSALCFNGNTPQIRVE